MHDGNWKLILPYGIVKALIHDAKGEIHRGNVASKYFIRIPVWYEGSLHYWDDLASNAQGGSERKRDKCKDNDTSNCLAIVPFSASYDYRKDSSRAGRCIGDYAVTMDQIKSTCVGKEHWWNDDLTELVENDI